MTNGICSCSLKLYDHNGILYTIYEKQYENYVNFLFIRNTWMTYYISQKAQTAEAHGIPQSNRLPVARLPIEPFVNLH